MDICSPASLTDTNHLVTWQQIPLIPHAEVGLASKDDIGGDSHPYSTDPLDYHGPGPDS